jgi:hypothetical protein
VRVHKNALLRGGDWDASGNDQLVDIIWYGVIKFCPLGKNGGTYPMMRFMRGALGWQTYGTVIGKGLHGTTFICALREVVSWLLGY